VKTFCGGGRFFFRVCNDNICLLVMFIMIDFGKTVRWHYYMALSMVDFILLMQVKPLKESQSRCFCFS
jgi:hypothetical protein